MMLPHLAARLYGTPLLIARAKLDVILAVLGSRIGLEPSVSVPEIALVRAVRSPQSQPSVPGIAVIPVHGTLVRRTLGLEAASGLTSYADVATQIDDALADPQVAGVFLDIDSPGGEAGGVFELADRIRAGSAVKPIWAHAGDSAFSAAYAIGAAANRLTLSRTAGVGSIGVIALHVDQSVKDAKEGIAYTAVTAGAHKNDFSPHAPLSPEAAASLQAEVDRLYAMFVGQVAAMRGTEPDAVRATEAGLYFGEQAIDAGLADAVLSLDAALSEFAAHLAARKQLARASPGGRTRANPLPIEPLMEIPMDEDQELEPVVNAPAADPTVQPTPAAALPEASAAAVAQARAEAASEAQAIAELCLIAGCPQRTAEYLSAGLSQTDVRRALLNARAEQTEIRSTITAEASTTSVLQSRPEASPVVAAVKKLNAKPNPNPSEA